MRLAIYTILALVVVQRLIEIFGVNHPSAAITDAELRWVKQDDARFPDAGLLAQHFVFISGSGPRPLAPEKAREYADQLLSAVSELTKEAMISLTPIIERVGEKLSQGEELELRARR